MSAVERIALSRERLRLAMLPPPIPPGGRRTLADRARHWPVIGLLVESVDSWWENHPLRALSGVASEASDTVVRPLAQRHPLALVGGAAAFGAAFAWIRPWRWLFSSALLAGLAPQLAGRLVAKLPIESWVSMAASFLGSTSAPRRRDAVVTPDVPRAAAPVETAAVPMPSDRL